MSIRCRSDVVGSAHDRSPVALRPGVVRQAGAAPGRPERAASHRCETADLYATLLGGAAALVVMSRPVPVCTGENQRQTARDGRRRRQTETDRDRDGDGRVEQANQDGDGDGSISVQSSVADCSTGCHLAGAGVCRLASAAPAGGDLRAAAEINTARRWRQRRASHAAPRRRSAPSSAGRRWHDEAISGPDRRVIGLCPGARASSDEPVLCSGERRVGSGGKFGRSAGESWVHHSNGSIR